MVISFICSVDHPSHHRNHILEVGGRRQWLVATLFFSTFLFVCNAKVESLQRRKCLCAMRMEVLEDDQLLLITYQNFKLQSVMYHRMGEEQTERLRVRTLG